MYYQLLEPHPGQNHEESKDMDITVLLTAIRGQLNTILYVHFSIKTETQKIDK